MISIYFYIFLISLWLGFFANKVRPNKLFFFLLLMIISLFGGFRWGVGSDFIQYSRNYHRYKQVNLSELLQVQNIFNEPIQPLIAMISYQIYDHETIFFFLFFLITIYFNFKSIERFSYNIFESIYLFFTLGILFYSFDAVRQALASSILIYFFLKNEGKLSFELFFFTFLSFLSHKSSILVFILFLLYFRFNLFSTRRKIIISIIIALIIHRINLFEPFLFYLSKDVYILNETYMFREINRVRVLFNLWPLYLVLTEKKEQYDNVFLKNMMVSYSIMSILFMNSPYFYRILSYFTSFFMIVLPQYLKNQHSSFSKKLLYTLFGIYWLFNLLFTNRYNYNFSPIIKMFNCISCLPVRMFYIF